MATITGTINNFLEGCYWAFIKNSWKSIFMEKTISAKFPNHFFSWRWRTNEKITMDEILASKPGEKNKSKTSLSSGDCQLVLSVIMSV